MLRQNRAWGIAAALAVWVVASEAEEAVERATAIQVLDDFEGAPEGAVPAGWEVFPLLGRAAFREVTLPSPAPPNSGGTGGRAGRLDYAFDGEQEARYQHRGYVCLPSRARLRGRIKTLSLRVYGDGSGNVLIASLRSPQGPRRQRAAEPITWQGWQEVQLSLGALSDADILDSIVLEHAAKGQAQGSLLLDDLTAITEVKPEEGLCVDLRTNRYTNVMTSSETVRISVMLSNLTAAEECTFRGIFADFDGTQFGGLEQKIPVPRDRPVWFTLPFHPPRPRGFFIVSATLETEGGVKDGLYTYFVVTPPATPAPPTDRWIYGINGHFSWQPEEMWQVPLTCAMLAHAGLRWLRTEMFWRLIEPERGKLNWAWYDYVQQTAQQYRIELTALVRETPQWASTAPQEPDWACYPPADMTDFGNFISAAAVHYRETIRYWEIWAGENQDGYWRAEPNPARYTEMLDEAYRAAHRVNPANKVLVGGLIGADTRFLRELMKDPRRRVFDLVAVQLLVQEGTLWDVIDKGLWEIGQVLEERHYYRPPWVVWTGFGTDYTLETQRPQAESLVKAYVRALTFGSRLFWNLFRDVPQEWAVSGLFLYNFTPKPAYAAVCAMTSLLPNAAFGEEITVAEGASCYAFTTDRGPVVVFWSDTEQHELLLQDPALQVFDLMGNPAGQPTDQGRTVTVGTSPLYFTGVADPSAAVRELMQVPKL